MTAWVLLFLVGTVAVAVAVAVLVPVVGRAGAPWASSGWPSRGLGRFRSAQEHLIGDLGRVGAAIAVYSAALGLTTGVLWVLGGLTPSIEHALDGPIFHSARAGQVGWLTQVNDVLTLMGNRPEIKIAAVVAGVVLAVWYRRRWWIPVLAIAASFVLEHYLQHLLAVVVDRGHPPTSLGTWPSGGCARLVSMYGLIIWLYLRNRSRGGRRSAALLWGALVVAAWLEGFSRVYLLKHWSTDVLGGWLFGALLLMASMAVISTLDMRFRSSDRTVPVAATAIHRAQADGVRG